MNIWMAMEGRPDCDRGGLPGSALLELGLQLISLQQND